MIKEEFSFEHIKEFLLKQIDLLIVGEPTEEERSTFFSDVWNKEGKDIIFLKLINKSWVHFEFVQNKAVVCENYCDLCVGLPKVFKQIQMSERNILLDISSLDNVLIMFLTKQFLTKIAPATFFASYISPEKYVSESGNVGFELCKKIGAVDAVPSFTKRETEKQTLCAFLGFEGVRLKGVLEAVNSFEKLIPIVAFPSRKPQWFNVTIWNSMDILQSQEKNLSIYKCYSESVFAAVELLGKNIRQDETVVLAPLGTRPHSMACAIFACLHKDTRILYDFVEENDHRAIGISNIIVYHLSSFIQS